MAEIVFVEINDNNIIVGVHSDDIPSALLPAGYSTVKKTVEDPAGLVGQNVSVIDETLDKRVAYGELAQADAMRLQLKQLSIELDLQERLTEDTTATQAEFDTLKALYEAL